MTAGNVEDTARFERAMARIDAAHAEDPQRDACGRPRELVYAERMSGWLARLVPDASEALRLAVRCQHLRRWEIPRSAYPEGAAGYRRWRTEQAQAHARAAAAILREAGYDEALVARVQALVRKEGIKRDPEAQALEDAACLVFLEDEFAAFAARHDEAKLVAILRKTWAKMSARGRRAALALDLAPPLRALVEKALAA
ncbi:MAG: DUF4202 domain-containing protein [Pseudomonadota bacterium]